MGDRELDRILNHPSVKVILRHDVYTRLAELEQAVRLLQTDNNFLFDRLPAGGGHIVSRETTIEGESDGDTAPTLF